MKLSRQSGVNPSALEGLREAGQQVIDRIAAKAAPALDDKHHGVEPAGKAPAEDPAKSAPRQDRDKDFSKPLEKAGPDRSL